MTQNEILLATFEARIQKLIRRFKDLKQENDELYAMVSKNEEDIKALKDIVSEKEKDLNALKMAKMLEITNGDLDVAKERLSKLIRDVNKCIALLTSEN
jgi:predicted  nucleic acid-binding Zn-ribbon protein